MPSTSKILMRRLERLEDRLKTPQRKVPAEIFLVDGATGEVGVVLRLGKRTTDAKGEK